MNGDASVDATTDATLAMTISDAVEQVPQVRNVGAVRIGTLAGGAAPRALIAIRIGLAPTLTLPEVARVIAHAHQEATRVSPDAAVFVEPDVAADDATPTESIVIRGVE